MLHNNVSADNIVYGIGGVKLNEVREENDSNGPTFG